MINFINLKELENKNFNEVKEIFNNQYLCYLELAFDYLSKNKEKELFEVFVDENTKWIDSFLKCYFYLKRDYSNLIEVIYSDEKNKFIKERYEITRNYRFPYFCLSSSQIRSNDFNSLLNSIKEYKTKLLHYLWKDDNNIKEIQDLVDDKLKNINIDGYLKDSDKKELLIVRLVACLESKLRYILRKDNNDNDIYELIEEYFDKYDISMKSLLHRLRIMRNNIGHSSKENVDELNNNEIKECYDYIVNILGA